MKDYCSKFPEHVFGIYIGDICKHHDDTYSTHQFYKKLVERLAPLTFNHELAFVIAIGGGFGCWIKYASKMTRRV